MSITYPVVLLAAVLLAAILIAVRMFLSHVAVGLQSAEKVDREHREHKRAERMRRRAFVEQQIERLVAVVPMIVTGATRGDALRAQLREFVESLGTEQVHAFLAQLTPEQQIRFVRLAEAIGVTRGSAPSSEKRVDEASPS